MNYYQSAAFPLDFADDNRRVAIQSMRQCARDYLDHRSPRGEVVMIPWPGGYPLEAYFLPPPDSGRPTPAIICIGEPGQRKEEYLQGRAVCPVRRGRGPLRSWSNAVTSIGGGLRSWRTGAALPSWRAASPSTISSRRPYATAVSGTCMSARS